MKTALACPLLACLLLAGCQREVRELRADPPVAAAMERIAVMPGGIGGAPPDVEAPLGKPYQGNAWQLSQGKRLYTAFNCKGCHADGGGAAGPALLDGPWIYGPDIVSLVVSIRDGRPNGMPAYRERLTTEQIWQLAGYVKTIGAFTAQPAFNGRNDEMQSRPGENRAPAARDPVKQPSRR